MTAIIGMSDSTFEKLKLIASVRKRLPFVAKGELNRFGLYCRTTDLKDGTLVLDAGGKFVRRLQVILVMGTHTIVEVREFKPWKWDEVVEPTYQHALEIAWYVWQHNTREIYDFEKELDSKPDAAKTSKTLEQLELVWNISRGLFTWDAEITGRVDSLLHRLAKLEQGLDQLDTVAPNLSAYFWVAKLDAAYTTGDAASSRQLESNLPSIISARSSAEITNVIQSIRLDAEESSKRLQRGRV